MKGRGNRLKRREGNDMAGQMVHVELPAGDTAKAREFWGSLFGWQFEEYPGPTEYHMTRFSETTGGAIYGADGGKRGARVYFDVDDIKSGDRSRQRARRRSRRADAGAWNGLVRDRHGHRGERVRSLADRSERSHARGVAPLSAGGEPTRSPPAAPGRRAHPCAARRRPRQRRSRARTGCPPAAGAGPRRSRCRGSSRDRCT